MVKRVHEGPKQPAQTLRESILYFVHLERAQCWNM